MKYGLVGNHLDHSYSPFIHSLLGTASYDLVSLSPEELEPFIKARNFQGLNVTIPYKKAVFPYLDYIDPVAKAIGAVNTIVRRQNALYGYNTDCPGFLYAAQRAGIDFKGKKVLVLGSGGASAAVQKAAAGAGAAEVLVVSRTGKLNYNNVYGIKGAEIIVNATPVGMYPHNRGKLIELSRFSSCCAVMDLVYNPLATPLIFEAQKEGMLFSNGLPMLVAQAKYASDLFMGIQRPDSIIENVLGKTLQKVTNIVLIGMPGCGKSSVGKVLAQTLGRMFVDTDEVVEKRIGKSIPEFFKSDGEAAFRKIESEIMADVGQGGSKVIATGGGSVLNLENVFNMRQNGTVVFLHRDIAALPTEGRPLSQGINMADMYKNRLPFYQSASDVTVDAASSPEETAKYVLKELGWV